jgi:signal transduction histidine kinase
VQEGAWAVPLWRESALIGVLLLGAKRGGGLYTQEAIEIARSSGERLLDLQTSGELARRLMSIQRRRMVESQVVDRRARRVLHDDVLPLLHTALLHLGRSALEDEGREEVVELLGAAHGQISDLLRQMPTGAAPEIGRLGLLQALRNDVEDELGQAFDRVRWQVDPEAGAELKRLPPLTAEVVFYAAREAIRNAARYGRGETGRFLTLSVAADVAPGGRLQLVIADDGVGISAAGGSLNGSGHGLRLHSTMMAVVGGEMAVESGHTEGTQVTLTLPLEHAPSAG